MKSWLEKNVIEMYLTHNAGKFAVAERFIRTLKFINVRLASSKTRVYG